MKIGIKLWSTNNDLYPEAVKLFNSGKIDFLELKYIRGKKKDLELLKESGIPIIIHTQNCIDGVCFSDGETDKNLEIFEEIEQIADYLGAEGIIIHPGIGQKEIFLEFLSKVKTDKLIIENMPGFTVKKSPIGFEAEELKSFLERGNFRLCLDFCHAIKAAVRLRKDPYGYIKEFLDLDPFMFHVCDGYDDNALDEHLDLGKGNFDLGFIKKCIPSDGKITLETPKKEGLKQDLRNVDFFRGL